MTKGNEKIVQITQALDLIGYEVIRLSPEYIEFADGNRRLTGDTVVVIRPAEGSKEKA